MPPSLETLERLAIDLPEYAGTSHPFGKGQNPKFYKEIADTAEGKTPRTYFFEKNLVGLFLALGRPVPYAFRTRDGLIRSLDAGCVKFLCNRDTAEAEVLRDSEGYIVAVRPLPPLISRFEPMRDKLLEPYAILARRLELPFSLSDPIDERRRAESIRVIRDGADAFRRNVTRAWGHRCAISGVNVPGVLDAAHIFGYLGAATNDLRNAILLRADLHILFDSHQLSFEYVDKALMTRISAPLKNTVYGSYDGEEIKLPASPMHQPAEEVVRHHFEKFHSRRKNEP